MSARHLLFSLFAALAFSLAEAQESSANPPVSLEIRGGRLYATVDLAPAFRPDLRRQLSNGLTNVIALHFSVLLEGRDDPLAIFARELDVLYDVWDENFHVVVKDAKSPKGRHLIIPDWKALQAFLTSAKDLDIAPVSALGNDKFVFVTRVELNPVSRELLARTRELMANPAAGSRAPGTPSRSMLGAMASYLLRGPDDSSSFHLYRSQPFTIRGGAIR